MPIYYSKRRLPTAFQEVDRIVNANGSKIDTLISLSHNMEIFIRFYCADTSALYLFQRRSDTDTDIYGITGGAGGSLSVRYNGSALNSGITRTIGHIYQVKAVVNNGNISLYVKDETTGEEDTKNGTYTVATLPTDTLTIFTNDRGERTGAGNAVYEVYIKKSGSMVFHGIPTYKISTNEVGLYDIANVYLSNGYTQVKYLESSGTQYIKLGLNTSTDTELEADISLSVIDNQMLWANNNTVANRISCYLSNTGNSNFGNKTLANNNLLTYFTLNTKTKVKENAEGIFINGAKRVNFNNEGTISGGDEMYIFTAKNTGASGLNGNMYDCTVKQSNTLKRDLVPCYNSNNVAGMYDKSWDNTKCGVVDLGTLNWSYNSQYQFFGAYVNDRNTTSHYSLYCDVYEAGGYSTQSEMATAQEHKIYVSTTELRIKDLQYTDANAFKQAMSGKLLYYQRTTDTTWQPPFYTNAGTGDFVLGNEVNFYTNEGTADLTKGTDIDTSWKTFSFNGKVYYGNSPIYTKKLSTPTNVSASGTTISFDPVTNATSYEIFADGVSIGTHSIVEPPTPSGSDLTVTQTYGATQNSGDLTLE